MADARANIRLILSTSNKHGPCDDLMKARPKLGLPCKQALLGRPTEFTHPTRSLFSLMVPSGRRDRPNASPSGELSICSARTSALAGRGTEMLAATGPGFAWKSATTEFKNPTGYQIGGGAAAGRYSPNPHFGTPQVSPE